MIATHCVFASNYWGMIAWLHIIIISGIFLGLSMSLPGKCRGGDIKIGMSAENILKKQHLQ